MQYYLGVQDVTNCDTMTVSVQRSSKYFVLKHVAYIAHNTKESVMK